MLCFFSFMLEYLLSSVENPFLTLLRSPGRSLNINAVTGFHKLKRSAIRAGLTGVVRTRVVFLCLPRSCTGSQQKPQGSSGVARRSTGRSPPQQGPQAEVRIYLVALALACQGSLGKASPPTFWLPRNFNPKSLWSLLCGRGQKHASSVIQKGTEAWDG